MKRVFLFLLLLFISLCWAPPVEAQAEQKIVVWLLGRDDCRHCKAEKAFLADLIIRRNDFEVMYLGIENQEHLLTWEAVTNIPGMTKATPITLIGTTVVQGFDRPETTGKRIEELLDQAKGQEQWNFNSFIQRHEAGNLESVADGSCTENCIVEPYYVSVPFYGVVDVKQYSLGVMAFILGFIDGFNPCAMWVLVTFLLILAQLGDKKKMWQFVALFLLAEAIMYSLILTVWYQTWDFIGLDRLVTPLVGLVAIGGGVFFLWEWKTSKPGECKVTNLKQRANIQSRIKRLATGKLTLATAVGIIMLAFSVNVIEFACSIGIPQAFTKILQLNQPGLLGMIGYNAMYVLAYMMDDLLVFGIALISFEKIGLTTKYSKMANLIGGMLMIGLGLMLIFKPEWLVVG